MVRLRDNRWMPDSSAALGRLIAHENSVSDLLAFLFERDPKPLIRLLGLDVDVYRCCREARTPAGRLDVVVYRASDDLPVAVLELKGASSEHGDQLERYQAWAAKFDPVPLLFYCTLDGDDDTPRAPWRQIVLTELFEAWSSAGDPHAAWLSHEIAKVLRGWDEEADGVIGASTGWYVPDLISRRTARAVNGALRRSHQNDGEAEALRTRVGNPMLMAWRRHPRGSRQAWIAVDVRSRGRGEPARPWLIRPCVDVYSLDRSEREALLEAHDLAVGLWPAMVLPSVRDALARSGRPDLAEVLTAGRHDGLRSRAEAATLAQWRTQLESDASPSGNHPVFRQDRGRRLATQLELHVTGIKRTDLADLMLVVLGHLAEHARRS